MNHPLIRAPFRWRWWCEHFHWLGLPIRTTQTCTVCGAVYRALVEVGPLRLQSELPALPPDPLADYASAIEQEKLGRDADEAARTQIWLGRR